MKNLLFTGGGGAGSEALYRLMGADYHTHFADADIAAKPYSIPGNRWHQVPFASESQFVDRVRDLCFDLKIDLLIPAVDEELLSLAQARATLGCEVLLPPTEFVSSHLDKFTSNQVLQVHGIPVPKTEMLSGRRTISFPCIVKPRKGRGSRGVTVVQSDQELQAYLVMSRRQAREFVVQELLIGQEYTVMMAADRGGRLCAIVPVRVDIKRGITLRAETSKDELVIAACQAIHAAQPVPGCYNIQLVKDNMGQVMPFEINPRISTTACLGLTAGVNFIDVFLEGDKRINRGETGLMPFRASLGLRRSWHNEFVDRNPADSVTALSAP
jgi:carbamoyl-phosphate synthase large subunit